VERGQGRALTAVLCALAGLAVGVGATFVLVPAPTPAVIASETGPSELSVVPQTFAGEGALPVSATVTPGRDYVVEASGVVRAVSCTPSAAIESGTSPLTVDDRPVLALHMASPPWRDMAVGSRGDDVTDLQQELARLGYSGPVTGVYTAATAADVRRLWQAVGVQSLDSVPLAQVIWLPETSALPSQCTAVVGDRLAAGATVFSEGQRLTGLAVDVSSADPARPLVATVGNASVPIGADGSITDESFLGEFAATPGFRQWLSDPTTQLTITTALRDPLQVVAVPPSALYAITGSTACLVGNGSPEQVTIVASQLGQTFVWRQELPQRVTVPAPDGAGPCV